MKRTTGKLPFLALLLGVVGLLLRRWQLATCFDESGLPLPGVAVTLLSIFTVLVPLWHLFAVRRVSGSKTWEGAFHSQPQPFLLLPAVGAAASGVVFWMSRTEELRATTAFAYAGAVLPVLMVVGSVMTAAGLLAMARGGRVEPVMVMLPGFGSCFWMVNAYHAHASSPIVPQFAWLLLAVVFAALGWYAVAGFAMKRGSIRQTLVFGLTAVVLCITGLAGGESLSDQIMLASQAAAFTLLTLRLTGKR